jgi:hypothetical protein
MVGVSAPGDPAIFKLVFMFIISTIRKKGFSPGRCRTGIGKDGDQSQQAQQEAEVSGSAAERKHDYSFTYLFEFN